VKSAWEELVSFLKKRLSGVVRQIFTYFGNALLSLFWRHFLKAFQGLFFQILKKFFHTFLKFSRLFTFNNFSQTPWIGLRTKFCGRLAEFNIWRVKKISLAFKLLFSSLNSMA